MVGRAPSTISREAARVGGHQAYDAASAQRMALRRRRQGWSALTKKFRRVRLALRKSLTNDQGKEMAHHAELTRRVSIEVFFADPRSPWQRPSNENMKELVGEYLPKGDDLSVFSQGYLNRVAKALNYRPRAVLDFATPAEAMPEEINKLQLVLHLRLETALIAVAGIQIAQCNAAHRDTPRTLAMHQAGLA